MDIIKLEQFIYVQKVNCEFFDDTEFFVSQYYFLITNKSIYFLKEYDNNGAQNYSSFKDNLEIFLKINHENFNISSYSSRDLYSSFCIRIRNRIMSVKVSDIQPPRAKSIKNLANILSILDGYKIITHIHNKNFDEYFDWILYIFDNISIENKIIINDEFFNNVDLHFLSDMVYFLTLAMEFDIKMDLFKEDNIVRLNYIFSKRYDQSNKIEDNLNLYFQPSSNSISNKNIEQHHDLAEFIQNNNDDDYIDINKINEADLKLGSLNTLRLSFNLLNDDYFFFLFKNLKFSLFFLKELEISHNNVTENIFPILNKIFKDNKPITLQKLLLNNNQIGGTNLEKGLVDLLNIKTLRMIDLSHNQLNNEFLFNLDNHLNDLYNDSLSLKETKSNRIYLKDHICLKIIFRLF